MARSTSPNLAVPERGRSANRAPAATFSRPVVLSLLISLRPHQWTKNLLVFAALIFAERLFDRRRSVIRRSRPSPSSARLSGVVYLVNDVADRDTDRRHPLKSRRPIAAGDLPVGVAIGAAVVLGAAALGAAFALGWRFGVVAATYLGLQALYSGPLKHIVIIDVLTLAIGFVLRAAAGARCLDVEHQPLAAGLHDSAGALHRARQAAARARAAGGRRHEPPAHPRRVQPVSARPDDRRWSRRPRSSRTSSTPSARKRPRSSGRLGSA